jgi:uncharacterized membrane protein YkoI
MAMDRLRILPAAAVMIALSATVYFARDKRENEEADFVRATIVERIADDRISEKSWPAMIESESGRVYLIEIGRNNDAKREVLVDASTGQVLNEQAVILDDRHGQYRTS